MILLIDSFYCQASLLLETTECIVDVVDVYGGYVMLALNDGMDVVPQLASLSQLYY